MPHDGVLDPQGRAVADALRALGHRGVGEVRVGRVVELDVEDVSRDDIDRMCEELLANPVIEQWEIEA
jgi:phosphoribosylformylglycinamidine synthase